MKPTKCVVMLSLVLCCIAWNCGKAQNRTGGPISEQDLLTLINLGIDEAAIVSKVQQNGLSFTPNEAAFERLEQGGASARVVEAVRGHAGVRKKAAYGPAITYQQIRTLLQVGISEQEILKRLGNSPTVFTLGADEIAELRSLNASPQLLSAMQNRVRTGATQAQEISDLVLVLDCSGSMGERTPDGQTKMQAAKTVLTDLIRKIPKSLHVAMLIYGHDKQEGCEAVKLVRPLSRLDDAGKDDLIQFIAQLRPVGSTPIANALEAAGHELEKVQGRSGLVLITDGKEMCHGDPAAVAGRLAQNPHLVFGVNVVGLGLNDDERAAVTAIARAGKGKYYDAQTADELAAVWKKVAPNLPVTETQVVVRSSKGNRRALKVLAPTTLELPPLKRIAVVKAGGYKPDSYNYHPVMEVPAYGREIRLPSGTEKYDIYWIPKEGQYVRLIKDFCIPGREVVSVKPESYLGLARVEGTGLPKPKLIAFTPVNGYGPESYNFARAGQTAKQYGMQFVMPAGKCDLWIHPADGTPSFRLEQQVNIAPGVVNVFE